MMIIEFFNDVIVKESGNVEWAKRMLSMFE